MNLRRLFKWCIDEGRLERKDNPCDGVAVARMAPKTRRAPTVAEVDALVALPKARPIDADAWRLMPLFARHTGARAGEIAQLRAEDVVVEQGIRCFRITAREGDRRLETVSSERLVPVASKLQPHLDELLAKQPAGTLLDAGDWKATSCPI